MNQSVNTPEELLADDSFLAYVRGTDTKAVRKWEEWQQRHADQAALTGEARLLVLALAMQPPLVSDAVVEQEVLQFKARLAAERGQTGTAWQLGRHAGRMGMAAALVVLLVTLAVAWMGFWRPQSDLLTCRTLTGESRVVVLPDSSVVILSGNSTLQYGAHWPARASRQVWLQGNAFFDVLPKPVSGGLKFQVHVGPATVEVLGTRFSVGNRKSQVKVVLHSGKVKVKTGKNSNLPPVMLRPGQMVAFSSQKVRGRLSWARSESVQKEKKIVFENAPVRRIALVVKAYYGLELKLQDSTLADLRISGTLPTTNEESFFRALALILDLEITKVNKTITFQRNL